jgi:hypothetical protein
MVIITEGDMKYFIEESYANLKKALAFFKKEAERQRLKSAKKYVPTGKPIGRPKKEIKIDDKIDNIIPNQD